VEVTGVILAGGGGRRMGRDKRGLLVDELPMLQRTAAVLSAIVGPIIVVEHPERPVDVAWLGNIRHRVVADLRPGGPLAGLEAGLKAADTAWVLAVAADMPWLRAGVLQLIVDEAQGAPLGIDAIALEAAPRVAEPLLAAYRRRVLSVVDRHLSEGSWRLRDLLADLRVQLIGRNRWSVLDPAGRSIINLNTPNDLELPT
jgi:molybdenum cofactor guanylyltransferase